MEDRIRLWFQARSALGMSDLYYLREGRFLNDVQFEVTKKHDTHHADRDALSAVCKAMNLSEIPLQRRPSRIGLFQAMLAMRQAYLLRPKEAKRAIWATNFPEKRLDDGKEFAAIRIPKK